jgi:hypothetical protein
MIEFIAPLSAVVAGWDVTRVDRPCAASSTRTLWPVILTANGASFDVQHAGRGPGLFGTLDATTPPALASPNGENVR